MVRVQRSVALHVFTTVCPPLGIVAVGPLLAGGRVELLVRKLREEPHAAPTHAYTLDQPFLAKFDNPHHRVHFCEDEPIFVLANVISGTYASCALRESNRKVSVLYSRRPVQVGKRTSLLIKENTLPSTRARHRAGLRVSHGGQVCGQAARLAVIHLR